jgi:S-adenosylmethionine/arginine decarboxylase-like enzyme
MLCPEVIRKKIIIELLTEVDLFNDVEEEFITDVAAVCDLEPSDIIVRVWPEHKLVVISILTCKDIQFKDTWDAIRFWFKPRRWEVLING